MSVEGSALRADCARCAGLCCVVLPFAASADFAVDKAAGEPCGHLGTDFRCGIHARLRDAGFRGCTVFDCFGAGQRVTQDTFGGRDWRADPDAARRMVDVFPVMRQLHELLWYLAEALELPRIGTALRDELRRAYDETERLTHADADALAALDVAAVRARVNALLVRAGELVRSVTPEGRRQHRGPKMAGAELRDADLSRRRLRGADLRRANLRGAMLIGVELRDADLRAASLRGACLIAADLRRVDLRSAELIGADLRDARLGGADLRGSVFLTQPQLDAARGDAATRLPGTLRRPAHWAA
ncbi:pentapeptide repeat-containing protein [Streptomyces sp. B6B3]|uniref:pentapeptide repeat-containing protein n=1 Tax=Streptomyces sp. B6B3 TaxID=3153570 RepID=UPI00325EB4AC